MARPLPMVRALRVATRLVSLAPSKKKATSPTKTVSTTVAAQKIAAVSKSRR